MIACVPSDDRLNHRTKGAKTKMPNIAGIIKSLQNIMRKDQGVSGDAQRIEQLGWMITLKILDDKDAELELLSDDYVSVIPSELQWRSWAADSEGITGDALKDFIDNKLFPGLQNLDVSFGGDSDGNSSVNRRAVLICCAICQHKKLLLRKNIKKNGRKAIDRHMAILIYVDSPENQVYRQVNGPPGILSL